MEWSLPHNGQHQRLAEAVGRRPVRCMRWLCRQSNRPPNEGTIALCGRGNSFLGVWSEKLGFYHHLLFFDCAFPDADDLTVHHNDWPKYANWTAGIYLFHKFWIGESAAIFVGYCVLVDRKSVV